ncbi:hypothetical protein [Flavobacterium sp. KACC 22761]|nr:hypothetical protein [Flavobacterium sp. KACC 22761]WPO78558.1 hypothetical protein SCB73_20045 [Flavobacterium sp. KACC 22761]
MEKYFDNLEIGLLIWQIIFIVFQIATLYLLFLAIKFLKRKLKE